jgi:hypothetical protein
MKKDQHLKILKDLEAKLKPAEIKFVRQYIGMEEEGRGWNNATISYAIAFDREDDLKKVYDPEQKKMVYSPGYAVCRSEGSRLLSKPNIFAYRQARLDEFYTEDRIKRRYSEIGWQNKNLAVALSGVDRVAKIKGILKDDSMKVDIPQLEALTSGIKTILEKKAG